MNEFEGAKEADQRGYKHPGISREYSADMTMEEKRPRAKTYAELHNLAEERP